MIPYRFALLPVICFAAAQHLPGQVLNSAPSHVLGHPQVTLTTVNPNWVEGRELFSPQGLAIDPSTSALYVSDSGNNRVLAWRDARTFATGAAADLVIGQRDRFSTHPLGPGTAISVGLSRPTGLAVHNGNLYVLDAGNNRILRFPNPFAAAEMLLPDLVVGQANFTSRGAGTTDRNLNIGNLRGALVFDGNGNLYVSDSGNRRVLRFPASALAAGARNGPPADVVLGQPDFTTAAALPRTGLQVKDRLAGPAGLAIDSAGRLYVADYEPSGQLRLGELHRVLVFEPPFSSGKAAVRIAGVLTQPVEAPVANRTLMALPEGVAILPGDRLAVADSASSRILLFPPFPWPEETASFSPQAATVIGQPDFERRQPNAGQPAPSASALSGPSALAVIDAELIVADTGNHRVLAFSVPSVSASRVLGQAGFDRDGINLVEGRGFAFTREGSFGGGMAIDERASGPYLYIADTFNNRVLGFRNARTVRAGDRADLVIGQPDLFSSMCNYPANSVDRPTQSSLCRPAGVAVDEAGNLYVADSGNSRVLRFPNPFAAAQSLPSADLVLGQTSFNARITDATARTMALPFGVAFGKSGLLVSDPAHHRVLLFAGTPSTLASGMPASRVFGQPDFLASAAGAVENRMNTPLHIAADAEDRLYVADAGNNRLLVFGRLSLAGVDPRPQAVVTNGFGGASLRAPRAVFVNPASGDVWVADSTRLLRYPGGDALTATTAAGFAVATGVPGLAVVQDAFGATFVADASNRAAVYYPAVEVLNSANLLTGRALAPGAIGTLKSRGIPFSQETRSFDELPEPLPVPRTLGDVEVLVEDQPVPLFYVSPAQINFLMPMNAPETGSVELRVVSKSSGVTRAAGRVELSAVSPALFTVSGAGSGQVRVVNEDGTIGGPANPARRGSVISLYGTGQGRVAGAPPDGSPVLDVLWTDEKPRILINNAAVPDEDVLFSGLAPGFSGVWQINVRIPETVNPGNAIPVAVQFKGVPSNSPQTPALARTTLAVRF